MPSQYFSPTQYSACLDKGNLNKYVLFLPLVCAARALFQISLCFSNIKLQPIYIIDCHITLIFGDHSLLARWALLVMCPLHRYVPVTDHLRSFIFILGPANRKKRRQGDACLRSETRSLGLSDLIWTARCVPPHLFQEGIRGSKGPTNRPIGYLINYATKK